MKKGGPRERAARASGHILRYCRTTAIRLAFMVAVLPV